MTYHFCEPAERSPERDRHQSDSSLLPTPLAQPESYALNGPASEAPQQQHVSKGLAAFRATNTAVGQARQQQTSVQEPEQKGARQNPQSWSRKLEWNKRVSILPNNGSSTVNRNGNKKPQSAPRRSGAQQQPAQDFQSMDQASNLDNKLDFDNANTELLLRAYRSRAAAGRLDAALEVLEGVVAAGRIDVLTKWVALQSCHDHCLTTLVLRLLSFSQSAWQLQVFAAICGRTLAHAIQYACLCETCMPDSLRSILMLRLHHLVQSMNSRH